MFSYTPYDIIQILVISHLCHSHMKTQSDIALEEWRTKLEQALADFRVQFNMDGHLSNTMMTIQEKNNFSHISFTNLQREFQIPTVEEGRTVSVHFYYGQLVGVINNVSHQ